VNLSYTNQILQGVDLSVGILVLLCALAGVASGFSRIFAAGAYRQLRSLHSQLEDEVDEVDLCNVWSLFFSRWM
jgi:hypothetical protein